ncbi:MAG: hypothetical protein U0W24_01485 [Bacteroidales bacterium]
MKFKSNILLYLFMLIFLNKVNAQNVNDFNKLINEFTPSKSIYFDWINRNWFGSNEKKVEANLKFFKWLHDEYGMQLDIYLMDAADIDQGPNCAPDPGLPAYGSTETPWFKKRYPNGYGQLVELAKSFNCRLGVWLGPDGYGKTKEEAMQRKEMLVGFCRDYHFSLFKFDACCSDLSPENQKYFIETMQECRKYVPDLIVLNHRITLNDEARKLTTTFLWEGRETYVDVNISNDIPAPHHRASNLERGIPPGLQRLTEDHGVCLSSCLDAWDDDLILQAFNRNLVLSPEIYGNPFLLSDEMFPRLARIYNIHRLYNDILVHGKILPEEKFGKFAVSRGDSSTRLITLRNLSWQPVQITLPLDSSIGLLSTGNIQVLQYHPVEKFLGNFQSGSEVKITVLPFRSCLIKISSKPNPELVLKGIDYHIIKNIPNKPIIVNLLGLPGEKVHFSLVDSSRIYKKASLNGKDISSVLKGSQSEFTFSGKKKDIVYLKRLGNLQLSTLPKNVQQTIETCLFALDNNAFEIRELNRSGNTKLPVVQACRDAFFNDTLFSGIGIWDKYAFDGDLSTSFKVRRYKYMSLKENNGAFRLDIGESKKLDKFLLRGIPKDYNPGTVEFSNDLETWYPAKFEIRNTELIINLGKDKSLRYLRLAKSPTEVAEIEGYVNNKKVERNKWKASNLFGLTEQKDVKLCWKYTGKLTGIAKGAYLPVTVPADCKEGNVFALMMVDGKTIAANERAPSFPYNNWEHFGIPEKNLTFYIPVDEKLEGKSVQVMLLSTNNLPKDMKPEVWLCNPDIYEKAELILE